MKILFVTNLPSPYRVDFFNELSQKCNLTVCYERESSSERDAAWKNESSRNFSEIYCKSKQIRTDKTIGLDLIRKVKSLKFDHLIISGYSSPSVVLLIYYCKLKHIPFFIETDGGFDKKDRFLMRIFKKSLIKRARGIFTTCNELVSYFSKLGCKGSIYKYPFSSLHAQDIYSEPANDIERFDLRKELGIKEPNIVITVGRFSYLNGYGKGYDRVLMAAKLLSSMNVGWYIIGGQPTDEFLALKEEQGLSNVHFVDFKKKEELKKYYRAADIFVLMTISDIWGLVINEAMACGLPVITTNRCVAGLEMIVNEENGYIIPVGDEVQLAEKVEYLFSNAPLRKQMEKNNLKKSLLWTIESMADRHIEILQKLQPF